MIRTLYAQVLLAEELLNSGYEMLFFVNCRAIHLKNVFHRTGMRSGGHVLLKENVNIWEDDVAPVVRENLLILLRKRIHIFMRLLTDDSNEVATTIAGYIVKKLIKSSSCIICKSCLVSENGSF